MGSECAARRHRAKLAVHPITVHNGEKRLGLEGNALGRNRIESYPCSCQTPEHISWTTFTRTRATTELGGADCFQSRLRVYQSKRRSPSLPPGSSSFSSPSLVSCSENPSRSYRRCVIAPYTNSEPQYYRSYWWRRRSMLQLKLKGSGLMQLKSCCAL